MTRSRITNIELTRFKELRESGLTYAQVSKIVGKSTTAIFLRLKYPESFSYDRFQNEYFINQVLEDYKESGNCHTVAKKYGVSVQWVYNQIKAHDIPVARHGNKQYNINEQYFYNIDSEEKAYWLGFIMADGCVHIRSQKRNSGLWKPIISFSLVISLKREDTSHLYKFIDAIGFTGSVKLDKVSDGFKVHPIVRLNINNRPFIEGLIRNGVTPRKSLNEIVPDIDNKLLRHFYRGYLDGDGCLSKSSKLRKRARNEITKWILLFYGGEKIVVSFHDYINQNLGIDHKIFKQKKLHAVRYNGRTSFIIAEYFYKDANVFLDRKYLKYLLMKNDIEHRI